MKRQSKSNPLAMNKKSSFHALLDGTLTPSKGRSKHHNPQSVQSPHGPTTPSAGPNDEIRDEMSRKSAALDNKEGKCDPERDDVDRNDCSDRNIPNVASNSNNNNNNATSSNSLSSSNTSIAIPPLYKECLNLFKAKQYRSAELLSMYNLTSLAPNSIYKAHALELVADCAFHQSQYIRASSYYKQAFDYCNQESFPNNPSASSSSNIAVASSFQAQLKHKESNCLLLSGNIVEASNLLESFVPIRSPFRTFAISMDLGRMYMTTGRVNDARRCFIDVLNKNIYALEAVECLAQLGSEKSAVSKIVQQKVTLIQQQTVFTTDKTGDSKENSHCAVDASGTTTRRSQRSSLLLPINDIVNATFYSCRGSSHALHAWNYWSKLLDQHPNHTYLLLQMALLQSRFPYLLGTAGGINTNSTTSDGSSSSIFAKIRIIDPSFMEGMDTYANILAKQSNKSELGRLCSDLLQIDDKRHEAWAGLALYHHTCGDVEKSLAFLEKGVVSNPRSAFCHQLIGSILLSEGRVDHAIISYFRANEICKDVTSYEGLVEAYLSCSKYKEAVCTAKEAISFAPRDPRAMTLVGLALMSAPGSRERGREKAKRTLKKAFTIDPTCRRSLFALVDLHLEEEDYDICIDLIRKSIDDSDGCSSSYYVNIGANGVDQLYSKMAEVHTAEKKYGNALECFHKALSINPNSAEAQRGMDELEKVMKYTENPTNSSVSDEYRYQSHRHQHQHHSYRYEESELESVVRAI
jgi:anaphase-promoting complex subunit 7